MPLQVRVVEREYKGGVVKEAQALSDLSDSLARKNACTCNHDADMVEPLVRS